MAAKKNNDTKKPKTREAAVEKESEKKKTAKHEETDRPTKKADKRVDVAEEKSEKPEKRSAPPSSSLLHQFIPFVLIVLSILIAVCLIVVELSNGDMGIVGNWISLIFCGLFGLGAFAIPVVILCLGICWHKVIDSYRGPLYS